MEFKPANQAKDRQHQSLFWFIFLRFSFFQYKYKTHEANIISYQSKYNMRNLYENLGLYVLFRVPRTHTHTHTHTHTTYACCTDDTGNQIQLKI